MKSEELELLYEVRKVLGYMYDSDFVCKEKAEKVYELWQKVDNHLGKIEFDTVVKIFHP